MNVQRFALMVKPDTAAPPERVARLKALSPPPRLGRRAQEYKVPSEDGNCMAMRVLS